MATYTACYTKIEAGYMGQLLEWPEVITEGDTLEECRAMLLDICFPFLNVAWRTNFPFSS